MTKTTTTLRNNNRRRAVFVSVSLLVALVAGGLVFALVEKFRDVADRTH